MAHNVFQDECLTALIKRVSMSMYRYNILVDILPIADSSRRTSQRSLYTHNEHQAAENALCY